MATFAACKGPQLLAESVNRILAAHSNVQFSWVCDASDHAGCASSPVTSVECVTTFTTPGLVQLANQEGESRDTSQEIGRSQYRVEEVLPATAQEYGVDPEDDIGFGSGAAGRDVAGSPVSSLHDGTPGGAF